MVEIGDLAAQAGIVAGGLELGRGAIAGALVVSMAYLAGFAVFRRGAAAVCGLLMVGAATIFIFGRLGLFAFESPKLLVLIEGLFGASVIVFLSSTIRAARESTLLGGVMFAMALSFVGLGVINLVLGANAAALMEAGLVGAGLFAVVLAALQSGRDPRARLVFPGVLVALGAPIAAILFDGGGLAALAPSALLALGVIGASLVSLTEAGISRVTELGLHAEAAAAPPANEAPAQVDPEEALRVSENQLAQVLDYSGVSVWDWSEDSSHQTEGVSTLMGAEPDARLTPALLRQSVHKDDALRLEKHVLDCSRGDGPFDVSMKLKDGRKVRLRGARAVSPTGQLERIVAFVESANGVSRYQETAKSKSAMAATGAAMTRDSNAASFLTALANERIKTVFQPIVDLDSRAVVGYEALIRWPDHIGGPDNVAPETLVRLAEENGKGVELAKLVLAASTEFLTGRLNPPGAKQLFVAMNLSVRQAGDPRVADAVREAIKSHDLPPRSLVLEITESQSIAEIENPDTVFRSLTDAGAALAFDDFGAGFSSLTNLRKYSFDYLKIDKSFIKGLAEAGDCRRIADAIAGLGSDLGLTVIAEGVESDEIAEAARSIGCKLGQGYVFGAPAPAEHTDRDSANAAQPGAVEKPSRRTLWRGVR